MQCVLNTPKSDDIKSFQIYNMATHVAFVLADINFCILIYLFRLFICGFITIFYFHVIFSLIVGVAIVEIP